MVVFNDDVLYDFTHQTFSHHRASELHYARL